MAKETSQGNPTLASIGIDIGKYVFHVVGFDTEGRIVLRRKIKRRALVTEFKKLPRKIAVQQKVGVPYPPLTKAEIKDSAQKQALDIATRLIRDAKVSVPGMEKVDPDEQIQRLSKTQMIALIAYIQKLGAYDEVDPKTKERKLINNPDDHHITN